MFEKEFKRQWAQDSDWKGTSPLQMSGRECGAGQLRHWQREVHRSVSLPIDRWTICAASRSRFNLRCRSHPCQVNNAENVVKAG